MTRTKSGDDTCRWALARLDAYIDHERPAENDRELAEHFERCVECTREVEQRQGARSRLRTAVREVQVPVGLEARVRGRLRQTRQPQPRRFHLVAIAATVAVFLGSGVIYLLGSLRLTTASQESYVAAISGQVAAVIRVGLGDHLHCAVIRKSANGMQGAVDKLPPEFKGLIPIVQRLLPAGLPLILAHECRYHGRKFVHLTFRNDRNLLSLVIAPRHNGELLGNAHLPFDLSQSGIPIYTAGVKQFQVAAFESRGFLVYTVSDLPPANNLGALAALAPSLREFLNQMGV